MPRLLRRRTSAVLALLVLLATAGMFAARRLPSAILPDVTFPVVKVIAEVGEQPAAEVLASTTRPLEEAVFRAPGVARVRSITSRGSTEISVAFRWGTDMQVALQRVEAEIQRTSTALPPGAAVDVEWMNTAIFPILGYSLTSSTLDQAALLEHAEFVLKPALLGISGVSQVQLQGGERREFQVRLDPARLDASGLGAADVVAAIRAQSQAISAGLFERNHELYLTLIDGEVHGVEALQALAVPVPGGAPVPLSELGSVQVGGEVSYVRTTADGRPAVLVNVLRQPTGNTVQIADSIDALLAQRPELVPAGARWATFYDQAQFVRDSVRGVAEAIAIGAILAALVLLVFLRSIRTTVVAIVAIPFSACIAGLALAATGQTINLMTLAGLAASIGLVADDAIVIVEGVHRAAEAGERDPVGHAFRELAPAIFASSLSTIAIFAPFALLSGVVGAFFRPLALTMALVLVASLLVSTTAIPLLLSSGGRAARQSGAIGSFVARGVALLIARRYFTGIVCVVLLLGAGWLYRRIGSDFLPAMDEGAIILDYWSPPGTSLTDTDAMLREVEKLLLEMPEVEGYSRRTGTQLGFFITEPNSGDYVIRLVPRNRRRPVDEVIDEIRASVGKLQPALHTDFGQLIEDNIGDLTGGEPQPIELLLFGNDPKILAARAAALAAIVAQVPGVDDVFDGNVLSSPTLRVRVDPLAAARSGLSTEKVHGEVEPALLGTVAGQVRVADRLYDLRVFKTHLGLLGELPLRAADGALVPLASLARIETEPPEAEIDRENLEPFRAITARLSGRSLGGAIREIEQRIAEARVITPGMRIRYGGQYEQQQASFRSLLWVLLAGLVLVGLVVLFTFGKVRWSLATMLVALASLAGSLAALTLAGPTLNVSSYVGLIMMSGIVGENAVFVIRAAELNLRSGQESGAAWAAAARSRLRPVAMTVLASAFALAPLAIGWGSGAALMQPLAVAVVGGFVASGPLVLWLLPALAARKQREEA